MNKKADFEKAFSCLMIVPIIVFMGMVIWMVIASMLVFGECNKLDECESYKCIQDKGITIFEQNNAALKYQNCLLEKKVEQSPT